MVSSGAGALIWQMWLKDQVRNVVREETAPIYNRLLLVAAASKDTAMIRATEVSGPLPQR